MAFFSDCVRMLDLYPDLVDLSIQLHRQEGTQDKSVKIFGMLLGEQIYVTIVRLLHNILFLLVVYYPTKILIYFNAQMFQQ